MQEMLRIGLTVMVAFHIAIVCESIDSTTVPNTSHGMMKVYDSNVKSKMEQHKFYRNLFGESKLRRSYSISETPELAAMFNGLPNLSGFPQISNGYATVAPHMSRAITPETEAKRQVPIYEEQNEHEENYYAETSEAVVNNDKSAVADNIYSTEQNQHLINPVQTVFHNPYANGPHSGDFQPSFGLISAYTSKSKTSEVVPLTPHQEFEMESNDKIPSSSFPNYYKHSSDFDALKVPPFQQYRSSFISHLDTSEPMTPSGDASLGVQSIPSAVSPQDIHDESTNFLPPVSSHQTNVINYLPYPVVKKVHVPTEQKIQIPVSQAVIIPVKRPVPIHIPITQQKQIPVEKELKIPIERVVPFPVEKHVPVPIEKRVPYPVVKYVTVKVPRPFGVSVPVFKTILHKVKSLW